MIGLELWGREIGGSALSSAIGRAYRRSAAWNSAMKNMKSV
jgi:hypothetical protein